MSTTIHHYLTVDHLLTASTRNYFAIGALVVLIWEYLITARDEFTFIWKRPINHVKCLYILSRYYGLAAQLIHVYLALDRLSQLPLYQDTCRRWAFFLVLSSGLLLAIVDIILMLRVYALYTKDTTIGIMLLSMFIMELGLDAGCAFSVYRKTPYDPTCDSYEMPVHSIYFTSPIIAMQTVIWSLTLFKTHTMPRSIPIARVVFRDGIWVFLLVVCIYMSTIPYVAASRVMKTHIALVLPISMLSISGCRLIMNIQRMSVEPDPTPSDSDFCLTSIIDNDME